MAKSILVTGESLMQQQNLKILVISAHPDDLEIACAGTVKRLENQGAEITSVITIAPSEEDNQNRSQIIVDRELANSYKISGWKYKIFKTDLHANGRPNLLADNVTMSRLNRLLAPCDIAIIPHPEDYHQDHRHTYELVWPALRKLSKEIWLMHTVPYCYYHKSNLPNLFYDISDQWEFKQSLLECYDSYFNEKKIRDIKNANAYWGSFADKDLCEAFTIVQKHA